MKSEIDSEIVDLNKQLRHMQDEAEAVTAQQLELREQLNSVEEQALELHQKIVEEKCDVGGEG